MSTIYLIRHAQASAFSENYDRLSDRGIQQAQILGDYIERLGLRFDAVYHGTLERQAHTVRIVLPRLSEGKAPSKPRIVPELNDIEGPGPSTDRSRLPESIRTDPSLAGALSRMDTDLVSFRTVLQRSMLEWAAGRSRIPGVETCEDFIRRIQGALDRIRKENGRGKVVAAFTSGGPIATVMKIVLGFTSEEMARMSWRIPNTSVSVFKYDDERISLFSFNSMAHLEALGDPEWITYI